MSITNPSASASTESDAYYHGMLDVSLLGGSTLEALDAPAEHKYLKKVTKQCLKIVSLLDDCMSEFDKTEGTLSIEEQITADMAKLKKLPIAKQCREMMLWRRVRKFSDARLEDAQRVGYGHGVIDHDDNGGLMQHPPGDTDEKFVSYREAYLSGVVNRYKGDLERIRESESLDAVQAKFLLSCLESSADLYANLQCIEDKEES